MGPTPCQRGEAPLQANFQHSLIAAYSPDLQHCFSMLMHKCYFITIFIFFLPLITLFLMRVSGQTQAAPRELRYISATQWEEQLHFTTTGLTGKGLRRITDKMKRLEYWCHLATSPWLHSDVATPDWARLWEAGVIPASHSQLTQLSL